MTSWTVHLPPARGAEVPDLERFRLVKDGLRPMAVVFGPLWFLARRLWLGGLAALVIEAALIGLARSDALSAPAPALLLFLYHLLLGLEASSIQRWTLRRQGWVETGALIAHGRDEAEIRAAALAADGGPPAGAVSPAPSSPMLAPRPVPPAASPVLGLFPEPRR